MRNPPFANGTLVKVIEGIAMMRGKPEDDTGDTVLIDANEIVLIVAAEFRGKNPHRGWWHVQLVHTNVVCWRLMDTFHIASAFEKVDALGVATGLQDRMLDEEDYETGSTVDGWYS